MATYFVIARSDDSSEAEVRLIEGDVSRIYDHGGKVWHHSTAWWTMVNDVLPEADRVDSVSVSLLADEVASFITMAAEVEDGDSDDDRAEAKRERDHLLAHAERLLNLARGETPWHLDNDDDNSARSITEEDYHEVADEVYGRGR